MAPISRRFLIPLFFTSLGAQVPLAALFSWNALMALFAAVSIMAFRHLLHARFARTGGDENAYLLLCPNFTLVALAANSLIAPSEAPELAAWLLMTGLLMTLYAVGALPAQSKDAVSPA
jgi:Kef-type K+ transport system membrane component KefB